MFKYIFTNSAKQQKKYQQRVSFILLLSSQIHHSYDVRILGDRTLLDFLDLFLFSQKLRKPLMSSY